MYKCDLCLDKKYAAIVEESLIAADIDVVFWEEEDTGLLLLEMYFLTLLN